MSCITKDDNGQPLYLSLSSYIILSLSLSFSLSLFVEQISVNGIVLQPPPRRSFSLSLLDTASISRSLFRAAATIFTIGTRVKRRHI
jgi:hypothetical protein